MSAGRMPRAHGTSRRRAGLAAALVAVAGLVAVLAGRWNDRAAFVPGADVARLAGSVLALPPLARVSDVAADDGTLYVLDGVGGTVVRVERHSGRVLARFGRRGGGPGEFVQPRSLAVAANGDAVVVADGETLHFFRPDGGFVRMLRPDYPCPVSDPQVLWPPSGVHVAASCVRAGSDTLFAVLWRVDAGGAVTEVAREGRFTFDGRWGSAYGPRFFASESEDAVAFGTASDGCVRVVRETGTTRSCLPGEPAYRAGPPPGFGAGARRTGPARWPDPLPRFVDRFVADGATWLVRPFRHDSVVVRRISAGGAEDRLVAPLDPFVRCRAAACYWVERESPAATGLRVVRLGGHRALPPARRLTPAAPSPGPRP